MKNDDPISIPREVPFHHYADIMWQATKNFGVLIL